MTIGLIVSTLEPRTIVGFSVWAAATSNRLRLLKNARKRLKIFIDITEWDMEKKFFLEKPLF
jgi:hypothetical protein